MILISAVFVQLNTISCHRQQRNNLVKASESFWHGNDLLLDNGSLCIFEAN